MPDGSFWCPPGPAKEASLCSVAGSHLSEKDVMPPRWMAETNFHPGDHDCIPVSDPEAEGRRIVDRGSGNGAGRFHCDWWAMMQAM